MQAVDLLAEELKHFRRGAGLFDEKVANRYASKCPELQGIWPIPIDSDKGHIEAELIRKFDELSKLLPEEDDLRFIFRVIFGLEPGFKFKNTMVRRAHLEKYLKLETRATQDRENLAISYAAKTLRLSSEVSEVAGVIPSEKDDLDDLDEEGGSAGGRDFFFDGWHYESAVIEVVVESYEQLGTLESYDFKVEKDGVDRVGLLVDSVPCADGTRKFPHAYNASSCCTGAFLSERQLSTRSMHRVLEVGARQSAGNTLHFSYTSAIEGAAAAAYLFTPLKQCDDALIKIFFAKSMEEEAKKRGLKYYDPEVWRVCRMPTQVLRDCIDEFYDGRSSMAGDTTTSWRTLLDSLQIITGEDTTEVDDELFSEHNLYRTHFTNLTPGLAYGMIWQWQPWTSGKAPGEFVDSDFGAFLRRVNPKAFPSANAKGKGVGSWQGISPFLRG